MGSSATDQSSSAPSSTAGDVRDLNDLWQPMDTAPKTGERILTCYSVNGLWTPEIIHWVEPGLGRRCEGWCRDNGDEFYNPGCWQWLELRDQFKFRFPAVNSQDGTGA